MESFKQIHREEWYAMSEPARQSWKASRWDAVISGVRDAVPLPDLAVRLGMDLGTVESIVRDYGKNDLFFGDFLTQAEAGGK